MLEIQTPLSKVERVSRALLNDTFVAAPGLWGKIDSDGKIANIAATNISLVVKLVIGNASSNVYESHDVEVGRITTMESHGVRVKVDTEGFGGVIGDFTLGDLLIVSSKAGQMGKVVPSVGETEAAGVFPLVAQVEEVGADYIFYRTGFFGTITAI